MARASELPPGGVDWDGEGVARGRERVDDDRRFVWGRLQDECGATNYSTGGSKKKSQSYAEEPKSSMHGVGNVTEPWLSPWTRS